MSIPYLINKTQHGFLKKRSCVTQLLSVLHDIGKNLDNNKQADLIYLDFSKAFDSVDHAILYQKLYAHGLRGSILLWFKDYLTDRCQRVVLDNVASEWSPVTSGVPQGSILGPLLFTIFINTLPDSLSPGSQAALYADDSKVFRPITSLVDSMALQQDLNNLEVWSSKNSIQYNPSKCKILTVTRKRNPITFSYKLTSNDLVRCDEERDLGITITYNLKWDSHITKIRSTANKCLGLLKRTCYDLPDTRVRRALYLSLVKSNLSYGSQVWSPETATLKKIIEGVQRRASLWILRLKRGDLTYVDRLKKLDLLPLSYDREIKDLIFYYKCRYGQIDLDIDIFTPIVSSRTRRGSSMYLQSPYCKTSTFKASYFNRIVHLWNLILKLAPACTFVTLGSFKTFLYMTYKELLTTTFDPDLPCTYSLYRTCSCHS